MLVKQRDKLTLHTIRSSLKVWLYPRKHSPEVDKFVFITMIITIIMVYVLLELTAHTRAQYKDIVYLQNNIVESTNSSLSMFDLEEVSLVKCGSLCLLNQCCKEFLYSRHNQRCIGVHFADFQSTSAIISLAFSSFEGMLAYQKGTSVFLLFFKTTFSVWLNGTFFVSSLMVNRKKNHFNMRLSVRTWMFFLYTSKTFMLHFLWLNAILWYNKYLFFLNIRNMYALLIDDFNAKCSKLMHWFDLLIIYF